MKCTSRQIVNHVLVCKVNPHSVLPEAYYDQNKFLQFYDAHVETNFGKTELHVVEQVWCHY